MIRALAGITLVALGALIHLFARRKECSMYYYIEFHADDGYGCVAGRRRFSDPRDADKFWDWVKADKYHRCLDSHVGYSREEWLPEIGWLKGRYESHAQRESLLAIVKSEPDAPYKPKVIIPLSSRKTILTRLQQILPRVATRVGGIAAKKGCLYFYQIARDVPEGAAWPKRQRWWMLAFKPLCLYNNRLICEASSESR